MTAQPEIVVSAPEFTRGLYLPSYAAMARGPWTLRHALLAGARGYWGDVVPMFESAVLMGPGPDGPRSWMSVTPSEVESQTIGLHAAHGHTAVFGMGMGWLAANSALKPEVTKVTIVERDTDVLSLIAAMRVFDELPEAARAKIKIIQADALTWTPDQPVDTLQADIWLGLYEPRKLDEARRMWTNTSAKTVYYWGQELDIWRAACRRSNGAPRLDWPMLRLIVAEDIRLPLILPEWPDYPEKIAAAASWWAPKDEGWWRET